VDNRSHPPRRWDAGPVRATEAPAGYAVGDELRPGRWSARELATGEPVVLQRVPEGEVAPPAGHGCPYLRGVRAVLPGGVAVLDELRGAPPVGPLRPGEVVTVGVPVALALAALHARGLAHGGVTVDAVRVAPSGMPVLDVGPGAGTPADDVAALGVLCSALLGPGAPDALLDVLARTRSGDPPAAAVLAGQLRRSCTPLPLGGVPEGGRAGRHRRETSPAARALVLVVLVVAAAGAGWWSGRGGDAAPPAASARVDWSAVLDGLDEARAEALAGADESALADVYAPGSPGLAGDRRLVRALAASGRTASGVRHEVRSLEVLDAGPRHARLRVVDELRPHTLHDGPAVTRVSARPARPHLVELTRTADGWRLVRVTPAGGSGEAPARVRRGVD
jgi:hypothetical protein